VKTPPSEATSQYPPPSGAAAMPTIGLAKWGGADPKLGAPPTEVTTPAAEVSQDDPVVQLLHVTTYVNWSPRLTCDVPSGVATRISNVPIPGGETAVISSGLTR
jgi:hypothetical protein